MIRNLILFSMFLIFSSCKNEKKAAKQNNTKIQISLGKKIDNLNTKLVQATLKRDFSIIDSIYTDNALLMAEYHPLIEGKQAIKTFYNALSEKQDKLINYKKTTSEITNFKDLLLEIGTFEKKYSNNYTVKGKYINVWKKQDFNILQLKAEAFGYFENFDNPQKFYVDNTQLNKYKTSTVKSRKKIPMEIQAYHALGENYIRDRNTKAVINSYTEDATFHPFADSAKTGKKELVKHFTAYHKKPVKIDSIKTWSYDYDVVKDGFIRYSKFYVKWTVPGYTGTTAGNGIAYVKRTENNALKIHRQIGTHIYNPK